MQRHSAKIILFGEYAVLKGGKALAIPFPQFCGAFSGNKQNSVFAIESNQSLKGLSAWLHKHAARFSDVLDLEHFDLELENGLWFDSNIGQKSGLGSSGALVAAVLHRYAKTRYSDPAKLQSILGEIESFFHSKSSGLDPLVSYLNRALLLNNGKRPVELCSTNPFCEGLSVFVVPTKGAGSTAKLVQSFEYKLEDPVFKSHFYQQYVPLNNQLVDAFMANNLGLSITLLAELSKLQSAWFAEMFDTSSLNLIQEGLQHKKFFLKLCGSGGGGYLLGFAKHKSYIEERFPNAIFVDVAEFH